PGQVVVLAGQGVFPEPGELAQPAQDETALGYVHIIIRTPDGGAQLQAVRAAGKGPAGPQLDLLVALVSAQAGLRLSPHQACRINVEVDVDVVLSIAIELQGVERLVELQGRLILIATPDLRHAVVAGDAVAHLTNIGYLPTHNEPRTVALLAI